MPVGEPQATGVRGHNRSLAPVDDPLLSAMDHDFHLAGIIPSVAFILDIPCDPADSTVVCLSPTRTRCLNSLRLFDMVLKCVVF